MDYFYHTTINQGGTVQQRCLVVGIDRRQDGYAVTIEEQGNRSSLGLTASPAIAKHVEELLF